MKGSESKASWSEVAIYDDGDEDDFNNDNDNDKPSDGVVIGHSVWSISLGTRFSHLGMCPVPVLFAV